MKEGVLVVKMDNEFLGIKASVVRSIVEITKENFKRTSFLSESVVGGIVHHDRFYPLVSLKENLKRRFLESFGSERAEAVGVILQKESKACALLVDDIHTIEVAERVEMEGAEGGAYRVREGFVEELDFSLLEKKRVPFLIVKSEEEKRENKGKKKSYCLLVGIKGKTYGIPSSFIRKVVSLKETKGLKFTDKGWISKAFSVGDAVMKAGNLREMLKINGEDSGEFLVVLEKGAKDFALIVDDVLDIIEFSHEFKGKTGLIEGRETIEGFIEYKTGIVPVVSAFFLEELIEKEGLSVEFKEEKEKKTLNLGENYLVFFVGKKRLGVSLKRVKKLVRSENAKMSLFGNYGGVIQVGKVIYPIVSVSRFVEEEIDISRSDFLLIESGEHAVAIPISEVDGIIKARASQKVAADSEFSVFSEAVLDENEELVNVLDVDRLIEVSYGS